MNLDMIGIIVKDMDESIKFYECMGLGVSARHGDDYVELEHDGIRISLNTKKMITGIYGFEPTSSGDKIELAFKMPTIEAVDILANKMKEEGYTIFRDAWDAPWGQRYAIIKDPNDNLLSLFCNLETIK
ncbi:MAG: VOC family protein [Coprobacillaceae bacterium]